MTADDGNRCERTLLSLPEREQRRPQRRDVAQPIGLTLLDASDEATLDIHTTILKKIARFEKVLGDYQEFSQLLKPHLEDLAVPLITLATNCTNRPD